MTPEQMAEKIYNEAYDPDMETLSVEKMTELLTAYRNAIEAATDQLKIDILAMGHAEQRIQFLESVLYAVRGCAGTCAKCKELINKIDAQGRSTADAEKAGTR